MRAITIDAVRGLAAAGVLLSAAVHLDLWDLQGFREIDVIGPMFLLNAVAGLVIGVLTVTWRHWFPALLSAGFGLVTVVAFWISVVHGLFGLKEVATGSSQVLAEVAELAAIAFGLLAAVLLWQGSRQRTVPCSSAPTARSDRGRGDSGRQPPGTGVDTELTVRSCRGIERAEAARRPSGI